MVYCRECGESVEESDIYCWNCGARCGQENRSDDPDENISKFWNLVENLIDSEVNRVRNSEDISVTPALVDRYAFAIEMYIIGLTKGHVTMLLISAFNEEGRDEDEIDFSKAYSRIIDMVEDREEKIKDALEKPIDAIE